MKRILIIATDGFEQSELVEPKANLDDAGAETIIASLDTGDIQGLSLIHI